MGRLLIHVGFLLILGSASGDFVNAQFLIPTLSLTVTPASPSPGERVTVEAHTPTFDRRTAFFSWTVNGKSDPELDGLGKNIINLSAGGAGSITTVAVQVLRSGGEGEGEKISIPVSELTLVWSADTYLPAWYKGRALPVQGSVVTVTAIPEIILGGTRVSPKNLLYRWSLDSQESVLSGVGENVFRTRMSPYTRDQVEVKVTVEDIDKRIRKEGGITLTPFDPKMMIYPYTPLGGVEPRNGTGFFFTKKRGLLDFIAEVFFLPIKSKRDLAYGWRLENREVGGSPPNPYILTIDTGARSGAIPISASADRKDDLMPSVRRAMQVFLR